MLNLTKHTDFTQC